MVDNKKINTRPILMNFFREWRDWWEGFDERDQSRFPTSDEKEKMLLYPISNSIIQHKVLPLLAPHIEIDGDEKQVEFLKFWLDRYYRRCVKLMYKKSVEWGFSVGERIIETVNIDNKPYWLHVGSFIVESDSTTLLFGEDKPEINGFKYDKYQVDRYKKNGDWNMPGMVYFNYEGDEFSKPYGESILNKLFWAWQLVMKTWTSMTVYQRLHSPFIKYFFAPELTGDADNKATDQGRAAAIEDLKKIKSTQGVAVPLVRDDKGVLVKGPDLQVVAPPDKEPQFNETIRLLNSLMYVSVNFPERLSEQFKDTGAYKMVETQKDYYTEYILPDEIENAEYFCHEWFTNPMLEVNFGKIDCTYNFTVSDKQKAYYVNLLEQLIQSGQTVGELDTRAIAEKAGVPVTEIGKPTIETTERKVMLPGIEFAATKADDKKRVMKWVKKVVDHMNPAIEKIKEEMYGVIKNRLEKQHGRMMPNIDKLFKNGTPKRLKLQEKIQIPNNVYAGLMEYIIWGWNSGQEFHCKEANIPIMDKPSTEIMERLRTLDDVFTGSKYLMGEGERLEARLYRVLANVRPDEALATFNTEFETYIIKTLPGRIRNIIHEANHYGTKDFAKHLQMIRAEEKKEQ